MSRPFVIWAGTCMGFTRVDSTLYRSDELFGVTYELEYRYETGWYLYSKNATSDNFLDVWCAPKIRAAVQIAEEKILKARLRAE